MIRKTLLRVSIALFIIVGFITWNLYLMEIDDHYGDLQEVYFDSKSGDIIVNKQTKKFGIITKN